MKSQESTSKKSMLMKGGIEESGNLAVGSVTETSFRPNQNKFGTKT